MPLAARLYLWLTAPVAVAVFAFWLQAWRGPLPVDPWRIGMMALLVVLGIVAQHFPLPVGLRHQVDVSISVYFAALLLLGAPAAIVLVGASQLVGQATLALRRNPATGNRRRTLRSVIFNTSQFVVVTGLGALAYYAFLPHVAPAQLDRLENLWAIPATAAAMYLANTLAVAVMVGLQRGQSPLRIWLSGQRADALQFAGLFLIGLVAALTAIHYPWAPLVMAMPAVLLYLSLKRTMHLLEREQEARAEAEASAEQARHLQAEIERDWAPLAAILAGMSDGVLVLDAARRVRYCNARAGTLLGIAPVLAIGHGGDAIFGWAEPSLLAPERARATWERMVADPERHPSGEIELAGPPQRVLLLSAFPVADATGGRLGVVVRDVTDSRVRAVLEERERIAMDLHDGVIQSLYAVVLSLGAQERILDRQATATRLALRGEVERLTGIIGEIRAYIHRLRTWERGERGLRGGLAALVEHVQTNTPIEARLEVAVDAEAALDPALVDDVLLIAREATSNVVRHSGAGRLAIRLARVDGQLVLTIADDGRGFDPSSHGNQLGQGLHNMVERGNSLGGRLVVLSEPGCGAEVRLELPAGTRRWTDGQAVRETAAGG